MYGVKTPYVRSQLPYVRSQIPIEFYFAIFYDHDY